MVFINHRFKLRFQIWQSFVSDQSDQFRKYFSKAIPVDSFAIPVKSIFAHLDNWIIVIMSYTVISDKILAELDKKIYYAITKIRSDRKRAEINAIHKEVIKTPIFRDITKDRLQDRFDKLLKNGTLLNKPNRDKDSLRLNT